MNNSTFFYILDVNNNMMKPDPYSVQRLMREYPALDYLMAETLLSFTEEELERYMHEADERKKSAQSVIGEEHNAGDAEHQAADK